MDHCCTHRSPEEDVCVKERKRGEERRGAGRCKRKDGRRYNKKIERESGERK